MLKDHAAELEVAASAADFDAVISRTLEGDSLVVELRVENKAGHKFPTGFPSRRTWIHLTVADGSGSTVFESGAPQADGRIAGNDADQNIVCRRRRRFARKTLLSSSVSNLQSEISDRQSPFVNPRSRLVGAAVTRLEAMRPLQSRASCV